MSLTHNAVTTRQTKLVDPAPELAECGIRDVLERIGDKWTLLVCIELTHGVRRFRELQRAVPGISQRMLTLTVRRLERDGMVQRTVIPSMPVRVEYELSALGRSLSVPISALSEWAAEHRDEIAEARRRWDARADDFAVDANNGGLIATREAPVPPSPS
jgi:DNA-binding HxlR family transcriptional regulator